MRDFTNLIFPIFDNTSNQKPMNEEFSDAVVYGNFDRVKEMISENPEIINLTDEYGFTVLHNVMSEEQPEIITYLISKGANVNCQNDEGIAPLHLACYKENAKFLLDPGADINLKDKNGNTPLHILAAEGDDAFVVVKYLLSKGADKNIKNNFGDSPYSISESREDKKMMRLFQG